MNTICALISTEKKDELNRKKDSTNSNKNIYSPKIDLKKDV